MGSSDSSLYTQIGGFDKILALTRRWHELCLADPVAAHPFEHHGHPQHNERLAAYLSEAFGGPALYTGGYGNEASVLRMHVCNGTHIELDDACIAQFDRALAEVGITGETGAEASAYFRRSIEDQRKWSVEGGDIPEDQPFNYA